MGLRASVETARRRDDTMTTKAVLNVLDRLRRRMTAAKRSAVRSFLRQERFHNREGIKEYDFVLSEGRTRKGVSLLVRAKNEGQKVAHCLRSVLSMADEVVFIDNLSEDRTRDVVESLKEREQEGHKIRILNYPFRLARFGPEHDRTPENSVHSAVYYSNWGLSHCSYQYVCKWDGDMVLTKEVRAQFRAFLTRVQEGPKKCWTFPGQTVYRDLRGDYYLAIGEVNQETMLFPYGYNPRFYKVAHWECLQSRPPLPVEGFEPITFFELKFADEDEFAHWSTTDWPSHRKQREWANFLAIRAGNIDRSRFERLSPHFLDEQVSAG
jgi:glycosyltransferase involved in cell wall biosynthesis